MATCVQVRLRLENRAERMLRRGEATVKALNGATAVSGFAFSASFVNYMYQFTKVPASVFGTVSLVTAGIAITSLISAESIKNRSEAMKEMLRHLWN